jgi:predicted CXXCH cytochrome family protein
VKTIAWLWLVCGAGLAAEDAGRILRPADKSAVPAGPVRIIARAPEGRLELDGQPVAAEKPFPDVLTARVDAKPGPHTLALIWNEGRREITFFAGPDLPAEFATFRAHPPGGETECTQCHELSRRGRFVFKGGCFDCHQREPFAKVHTHNADVLSECGLCHNAHGSTVKSHLLFSKDIACRQCHN